MKKVSLFILFAILIVSCKKDEDILFDLPYVREFSIPAGLNTFDAHYFRLENIPIGNYLSSNNVTATDLAAIRPGNARISSIFSGLGDYSFIFEISVRMYTEDENNYKEIFYRDNIPLNTGEDLDLIPTLVDVRDFMGNTRFNLLVRLELSGVPPASLDTRLNFNFKAL